MALHQVKQPTLFQLRDTFWLAHLNPTWTCRCASLSKASSEAQSLAKAVVFPVLEFHRGAGDFQLA